MSRVAVLFLWLAACTDRFPRQAVVEVTLEAATSAALKYVQVNALETDGGVRGTDARLLLEAPYVRGGRVSFGVVPDPHGDVVLRFRGYAADESLRLEQRFAATTQAHGVTRLKFTLSDTCLDRIPCDAAPCATASAERGCGEPVTEPGACLLGTVLDCGECGADCNMSRVALAACIEGECRGTCEDGYGDCDGELRENGCEVSLMRDAKHCGGCKRPVCPFGVCVNGTCTRDCDGFTVQTLPKTSRILSPNRLLGSLVRVEGEGYLSGLGVSLPTGPEFADTLFRLALYENDPRGNIPMRLVDQTSEMSVRGVERDGSRILSECGGLEMRVPNHKRITQRTYWLFVIASAPLEVYARPIDTLTKTSLDDVDYATLEYMPEYAHLPSLLKDGAAYDPKVYLVRTPLEE